MKDRVRWRAALLALVASVLVTPACDDGGSADADGDADIDGDGDGDGDRDADGDGDTDPDADGDGDAGHATVRWVLACQNDDGGFGAFPGDISALRPTAAALEVLALFDVSVPAPERIAAFLAAQQNADGGFRGRPWGWRDSQRSTLIDTHHAVRAFEVLGESVPRADSVASYVASRQRADGGFLMDLPYYLGDAATVDHTYYAVSTLASLGADVPRRDDVLRFLRAMQEHEARGNGSFMREHIPSWVGDLYTPPDRPEPYEDPGPEDTHAIPRTVGLTRSTFFGAAALSLLGEVPPEPEAALAYLASQQHADGGFRTGVGDYGAYHEPGEGRTSDAAAALAALRLLVEEAGAAGGGSWPDFLASGSVDVDACARWIAACQGADGGFSRSPDPLSRPTDMVATRDAVLALLALGQDVPEPDAPTIPRREVLPVGATLLTSYYLLPELAGEALYAYRIVAPIREAAVTDEATAVAVMGWINRHLLFGANTRSDGPLIVEDAVANCGGQSQALVGLLHALGIHARLLGVEGHNSIEALLDGRWVLLDPMFDGAYERPDGGLHSALTVHEHHRTGSAGAITPFGDWRYAEYLIYWPQGVEVDDEVEISIGPDDDLDSEAAAAAYPDGSY